MKKMPLIINVRNEWDQLKEAMVGREVQTMAPDYMPEMSWMDPEQIEIMQKQAGKLTADIRPDMAQALHEQIEAHVKLLESHGVKVHRTVPLQHTEELNYLSEVQRGNMIFGAQDFFVVIGNNVILLSNFRYPFRRKQVYGVRPVLEPLLASGGVRYAAMPPPSPHYTKTRCTWRAATSWWPDKTSSWAVPGGPPAPPGLSGCGNTWPQTTGST